MLLSGRFWQPDEVESRLAAVTPEAIRDVMKAILRPERAALVLVGQAAPSFKALDWPGLLRRHAAG